MYIESLKDEKLEQVFLLENKPEQLRVLFKLK